MLRAALPSRPRTLLSLPTLTRSSGLPGTTTLSRPIVSSSAPSFHTSSVTEMSAAYKVVQTEAAPAAIGPYVQATVHNGLIFTSGSE